MIFNDEFVSKVRDKIKTISSVQFGIILILFFMPFISVSCSGAMNVELSGVEMAIGTTIPEKDPFSGRITERKINAELLVSLTLLVTVIGFIVSFIRQIYLKQRLMVLGLSSVLGVILLVVEMVKVNHQITSEGGGMVQVSWALAYWLSLFLFLMITASVSLTWLSLKGSKKK